MSEHEPAVLRDDAASPPAPRTPSVPPIERSVGKREAASVYVAGFWKRAAAAAIDFAIVVPVALIITLIVGSIAGVHLPGNLHLLDIDLWIDLALATDPALVTALALFFGIGLAYLLVAHIVLGRTLGMRVLKIKIIDVYGDPPAPGKCVVRVAGYLVGLATLFLGFLWMGFDSEKRGVQDWMAGTYVIRA